MDNQKPKCFTEEEIKGLAELIKDAVRWTLSEKDFEEAKDNAEKENEPQQWVRAIAFFITKGVVSQLFHNGYKSYLSNNQFIKMILS